VSRSPGLHDALALDQLDINAADVIAPGRDLAADLGIDFRRRAVNAACFFELISAR
jgi:hypothetical protein